MKSIGFDKEVGKIFSVMGNPFRIQILLSIGDGEACVCHLEALLGKRQAFISQHLMALRKEGILETRREGKYIYYRLANVETIDLIHKAAELAGLADSPIHSLTDIGVVPACPCPKCEDKNVVRVIEVKKPDASQ
jgi:ArsR family transcriptional regulator